MSNSIIANISTVFNIVDYSFPLKTFFLFFSMTPFSPGHSFLLNIISFFLSFAGYTLSL